MTLLDTNILIDVVDPESRWTAWSYEAMLAVGEFGPLRTNHVILAELSVHEDAEQRVRNIVARFALHIEPLTDAVAFRAGQAHFEYRRRGGERQAIIADFLIGAHAAVLGIPLVTRDRQRFASYFPELTIIAPESENA